MSLSSCLTSKFVIHLITCYGGPKSLRSHCITNLEVEKWLLNKTLAYSPPSSDLHNLLIQYLRAYALAVATPFKYINTVV